MGDGAAHTATTTDADHVPVAVAVLTAKYVRYTTGGSTIISVFRLMPVTMREATYSGSRMGRMNGRLHQTTPIPDDGAARHAHASSPAVTHKATHTVS